MATDVESLLREGQIEVVGRLVQASNATLFVRVHGVDVDGGEVAIDAVYKPVAGEAPLWDFPDGTLAFREVATFELARLLQWDLVPTTIFREGPYGPGMLQQWIDTDESVDLIALVNSSDERLAHLALFDALINNTDRKVSHLLPTRDGRVLGCDHGVTFHVETKLRTVLWQFRGEALPQVRLDQLRALTGDVLANALSPWLADEEIEALIERSAELIASGSFPLPSPSWPAVPWPPI